MVNYTGTQVTEQVRGCVAQNQSHGRAILKVPKPIIHHFKAYRINMLLNTKNAAIGTQFQEARDRSDLLNESKFQILRKCQGKFDCLVFEMLYIKKFKPNLNVQTDPIRAKRFV